MATNKPFKDYLDEGAVRRLAASLASASPGWAAEPFVRDAVGGLDQLELKARVGRVAEALARHLPADFDEAVEQVLSARPDSRPSADDVASGFAWWPVLRWVQEAGQAHFTTSMRALHALTSQFSAEFAIRPFLVAQPERTLAVLASWVDDPDPHVRRLVSEGTRPMLPWGGHLRRFRDDPSETLALLDRLVGDSERYVQRSVANHLGDIAKDHPHLAVEVAARWKAAGHDWVVAHGLRALVKAGDADALAVLGYAPPQIEVLSFRVSDHVRVGDAATLELLARSTGDDAQRLMIDYAVHHAGAKRRRKPKVFKWARRTLEPGEELSLQRTHSMRRVTTRALHAGTHLVDVQINGVVVATDTFELSEP